MHILDSNLLESPSVIIAILILCCSFLAAIGAYFAVRGMKTANGDADETDFSKINKLERRFVRAGKHHEDRCLMYITVYLDNYRSLYSEAQTAEIFSEIKRLLLDTFSNGETSAAAACGDDHFVVFAKYDMESARNIIESFQTILIKVLLKHSALNLIEVRIGSFFAIGSNVPFDEAINRANQAAILAKNEKLSYVEWNTRNGRELEKKIKIENNIENEIDNNHFFLEYQPVLDAKTKEIIGAEVLSRLNSETDGVVSPAGFLSAVDSVGINAKFDYYIFEKNCKWISNDKKQREGYKYTINFSRSTLSEPAFAERIIGIAEKYGLQFSCLAVEILEDKNVTGESKRQMTENLSKLKEKGVSILLDDFGSGFTTFGDLQNLDISIVKIDRAITQNATTETGFIILQNIIRTSKEIGFKTLCEGVETKEQEDAVIAAGCDLLQGYYYYKPMSVAMLETLLEKSESDSMETQ